MIYCIFNTVFKRITLCLVYWVFDCVRFAKHEPKHTHTQTHTPPNIIPPMSNSSIALNVISIARKQFFFRLLLCFHLRFSRPFLTTFNHLCLLNFPFRAQDLPYGKIEGNAAYWFNFRVFNRQLIKINVPFFVHSDWVEGQWLDIFIHFANGKCTIFTAKISINLK